MSGLNTVVLTVEVGMKDVQAQPTFAFLSRTAPAWDRSAPGNLNAVLTLVSGTDQAGTWRGTVQVPSSADGSWVLDGVDLAGDMGSIDPKNSGVPDPTLTVTGTHRPRLRFGFTPEPLPYPQARFTMSIVASYDDTPAPVSAALVNFAADFAGAPGPAVRTDAHGRAAFVSASPLSEPAARMVTPPDNPMLSYYARAGDRFVTLGTATVGAPDHPSVPRRRPDPVNGHVFAIPGVSGQASTATMPVQLQRLYGRHYRTVATGTVRSTGRFTLTATPPKGLNYYRVLFPAGRRSQPLAASSTRPFTIRGT